MPAKLVCRSARATVSTTSAFTAFPSAWNARLVLSGRNFNSLRLCNLAHSLGVMYLFANARATRIKLLVHDGFGVWCAARRLNAGHFAWPREASSMPLSLTQTQFDALIVGLPWQRLPEMSVITRM